MTIATKLTEGKPIHPKVKAAGLGAAIVTVLVAVLAIAGVELDSPTVQALTVVVASMIPVVAGFAKRA